MSEISILGFAGSLRKGSYNKTILHTAAELLSPDTRLEIFDLDGIPPFNQDHEMSPSPRVVEFKAKIRAADAILIATPEYNYSFSGVLKNAIDSASRPYGDNAFDGKPVAIMSASIGMLGGARAQYHLRQTFIFLNMVPVIRPEVFVGQADKKIDEQGRFTDEVGRKLIKELVENLVKLAIRMKE